MEVGRTEFGHFKGPIRRGGLHWVMIVVVEREGAKRQPHLLEVVHAGNPLTCGMITLLDRWKVDCRHK
jgi:hypothetical protein